MGSHWCWSRRRVGPRPGRLRRQRGPNRSSSRLTVLRFSTVDCADAGHRVTARSCASSVREAGAGASTLAAGVALAGARSERRVVLVDGDPHGAGLDPDLGAEQEKGLRWGDLADVRGSLPPRSVLGRLPVVSGVPLLSHRRGESSDQPAWVAVTESVAEAADLVVADLPRFWVDRVPTPARCLDVLVVPDVAGVAAARSLLDRGVVRSDAVVALRRIRGPLAPAAVSEALPHQRIVDLRTPRGSGCGGLRRPARAVSRGGYATACRQLVELVAGSGSRGT